jgi:nicotinamidase-related amidase
MDGPISPLAVHLCLDMQNLIGPQGPWKAGWAERILPAVVSLAEHAPERTIFTRFIPPHHAAEMPGAWRSFYEKWYGLTLEHVEPNALDLLTPLQLFVPPARLIDKSRYSAFSAPALIRELRALKADALILSGAESDMCVLSTVLSAVDLGYPVTIATDAICSSTDACHDAVVALYHQRFSRQIRTLPVEAIREFWRPAK